MENLFHNSHNLLAKKDISSIKSIDNNKLIISYSNGISIYDSEKMDLITKRNIDVKGPLLILKNKNYLIGSYCGNCLFILHKSKLNIIYKMYLLSKFYNYNIYYDKNDPKVETNLIELSNWAIVYTNKNGIIIYNKVNNKYILSKYIIISSICTIAQFTEDYFVIKDIDFLYK